VSRLLHVAVREYLENVRTKAFLIAVFMTPVLMGLSFLIPALLDQKRPELRRLAIVDVTGTLAADVAKRLEARRPPGGDAPLYAVETVQLAGDDVRAREATLQSKRAELDARVLDGRLFAYVVLRPSALDRTRGLTPSEFRGGNLFDVKVIEQVRSDLAETVNARVVEKVGLGAGDALLLTTRPPLEAGDVRAKGQAASIASTIMPLAFTFLLFITIMTIGQALVTSTIEEKANRVIEVLLSSVSPFQLMAGKIVGTCAVGLTLMTIWAAGGLAGLAMNGLQVVSGGQLALLLVFYLLGFLFFAILMVAIGSACNTLKEAQNLLAPVMALISLSMIFLVAVAREPNGTLARVLSFIPLFTPFLMMMRIGAAPPAPPTEIAAAALVLALSAFLAMKAAGRIFRVAVLLYGKPPTLRELWRWMWAR
jgi:ABC-2 type transport system permease protein